MPTKTELEEQVAALVDELAHKQEAIDTFEARYAQETSDEIKAIEARRCINCGYPGRVSYDSETKKFTCASCKYSWDLAEEQSPHRQR